MSSFVETSVLARYFTSDPPSAADKARRLIESDTPILLTNNVLVETDHVLRKIYGLSRQEVIDLLIDFIQRENVSVHHLDKASYCVNGSVALSALRVRVAASALIWAGARTESNAVVYSFDQRFPKEGIDVREPE